MNKKWDANAIKKKVLTIFIIFMLLPAFTFSASAFPFHKPELRDWSFEAEIGSVDDGWTFSVTGNGTGYQERSTLHTTHGNFTRRFVVEGVPQVSTGPALPTFTRISQYINFDVVEFIAVDFTYVETDGWPGGLLFVSVGGGGYTIDHNGWIFIEDEGLILLFFSDHTNFAVSGNEDDHGIINLSAFSGIQSLCIVLFEQGTTSAGNASIYIDNIRYHNNEMINIGYRLLSSVSHLGVGGATVEVSYTFSCGGFISLTELSIHNGYVFAFWIPASFVDGVRTGYHTSVIIRHPFYKTISFTGLYPDTFHNSVDILIMTPKALMPLIPNLHINTVNLLGEPVINVDVYISEFWVDGDRTWQGFTDLTGQITFHDIPALKPILISAIHPRYAFGWEVVYLDPAQIVAGIIVHNITLFPTDTGVKTDLTTYTLGSTVTINHWISRDKFDPVRNYQLQIIKHWSIINPQILIPVRQQGVNTWTPDETGYYTINLMEEHHLLWVIPYWVTIVHTNFSVIHAPPVTPAGTITVSPTVINRGANIWFNTTGMSSHGKIQVNADIDGRHITRHYIVADDTLQVIITHSGHMTAFLYVWDVFVGRYVLVDQAGFEVLEDIKEITYLTIYDKTVMRGMDVNYAVYTNRTNVIIKIFDPYGITKYTSMTLDTFVRHQRKFFISTDAPFGTWEIQVIDTNVTPNVVLANDTFKVVGDTINWVVWDSSIYYIVGDEEITVSYSFAHEWDTVRLTVFRLEDGETFGNPIIITLIIAGIRYLVERIVVEDIIDPIDRHGTKHLTINQGGTYFVKMERRIIIGGITFAPIIPEIRIDRMEVVRLGPGDIHPVTGEVVVEDPEFKISEFFQLVMRPAHHLFGEALGNGIFVFLLLTGIAILMAQAGIGMSVIGFVVLGMTLMFVWVGMLPLFLGVLLVLLGSGQFVKIYLGR